MQDCGADMWFTVGCQDSSVSPSPSLVVFVAVEMFSEV